MRIGSVQPGRPEYYDRNPTTLTKFDEAGYAPHGGTIRWTYTVPSDKKAYIQTIFAQTIRVTAAAPVGGYQAIVRITPVSGTVTNITKAISFDNTVNAITTAPYFAGVGLIGPGDVLEELTVDSSTGGSVGYYVDVFLVQFDA